MKQWYMYMLAMVIFQIYKIPFECRGNHFILANACYWVKKPQCPGKLWRFRIVFESFKYKFRALKGLKNF